MEKAGSRLRVLALLIAYLDTRNAKLFRAACIFTAAGLLASVYFVIIQAFVLSAYCFYCLISAGTSTLLFILGMVGISRRSQEMPVGYVQ